MRNSMGVWLPLALGLIVCFGTAQGNPEAINADRLLNSLGADEYSVRLDSQNKLIEWGKQDLENRVRFFREQQQAATDPEIQERCRDIVSELVMILVDQERPGFIGITMDVAVRGFGQKVDAPEGVRVLAVIKEAAAEKFGLKPGDLITQIDDLELAGISGPKNLQNYVSGKKSGTEIKIHIKRDQEKMTLPLTLMPRPLLLGLSSRQGRLPVEAEIDGDLTDSSKAELERIRKLEVEKWLKKNNLEPSSSE